ncbi:response regulator [Roseovarius sp. S4756]|uniref:response regulator n=1 Tax=Roseovarius maritimus TaxID=3342637 RepID=UPI00372A9B93
MRILLVDDDPIIRDLLSASLVREGFTDLTLAQSGVQALQLVTDQEIPFDCYLLDIAMEQMDGIELCNALRQRPECRSTPIIMITSGQASDLMERAFGAGATDFLRKPLDHIEVVGRLKTAMLLVEATKKDQRARQALCTLMSHAEELDLIDPSAPCRFPDVRGMIDYLELENRLLRLEDGQYQMSLCRVQISSLSYLAEVAGTTTVVQLLYSLSWKISETISNERHWFSYIGAGRFVCCAMGKPSPVSSSLQGRLEDAAFTALDSLKGAARPEIKAKIQPLTGKRMISKHEGLKLIRREINHVSASAVSKLPEVDSIEERIFAKADKVRNRQ